MIFLLLFTFCTLNQLVFATNTWHFATGSNTYIAVDSWRPCLTGFLRFDIRTNASDGTLAYIDDRGKFDFFYVKLIEGKVRLLFNLGNDRQALFVNRKINDDQWHTILVERYGKITGLTIDHWQERVLTMTRAEDLFFGGATYEEYEASPLYFGGIPSILERPSSGNLSSFDVYMQPRFHGLLRNIIYKNCSNTNFLQPSVIELSGNVSAINTNQCSQNRCDPGRCLIHDQTWTCLCNEIGSISQTCDKHRYGLEMTFLGRQYRRYRLNSTIQSTTELISFRLKTSQFDGLILQLKSNRFTIRLKQGQLVIDFCLESSCYESSTKDLEIIDDQWHFIQFERYQGHWTLLIDQDYFPLENEMRLHSVWTLNEFFIGGTNELQQSKLFGCLKDLSIVINENQTISIDPSSKNLQSFGYRRSVTCEHLFSPVEFLSSFSYLTVPVAIENDRLTVSFRFQTFQSDGIVFYTTGRTGSTSNFFGFDLIDGFLSLTIDLQSNRTRQELFHQRFNDGQTHSVDIDLSHEPMQAVFNITIDSRQSKQTLVPRLPTKFKFDRFTIGGRDPTDRWFPIEFWSGVMRHGFMGCFSSLVINDEQVNISHFIDRSNQTVLLRSGPCSTHRWRKQPCLCEHDGECRIDRAGRWSCDCSTTAYTGERCEQLAFHVDFSQTPDFEWNTQLQWSEQIDDIQFRLRVLNDEENFLLIRPCRLPLKCFTVSFSIRNGALLVTIDQTNLNFTGSFLLDQQWHLIHLRRFNNSLLMQIDHHLVQNFLRINPSATSSAYLTLWLIFQREKNLLVEDLKIYGHSIYPEMIQSFAHQTIRFQTRSWKPLNSISLEKHENSHLEIPFRDRVCPDCTVNSIDFKFRTLEWGGILLFAPIRYEPRHYLSLTLVNGHLQLTIATDSMQTQLADRTYLNDGRWHHVSLYRVTDHLWQFTVDSDHYFHLISFDIRDRIYFGRPSNIYQSNSMMPLKSCISSLSINSRSINLRQYIKSNVQVRNDCFLDSQCPLKTCANTGQCFERIECQCAHTSFQGRFCTEFKVGYAFQSSGLIFDQPFSPQKPFQVYRLSFGLITNATHGELIRINNRFQIELQRGTIRLKFNGTELMRHERLVNDSLYHLVQIVYNATRHLLLTIDNKPMRKMLNQSLPFDKPLVLFIGHHPSFRQGFQGQLYGLESDTYSIFDLISPTFQRLVSTSNQTLTRLSRELLVPQNTERYDDLHSSSCSYQVYDDVCIVQSESNSNLILFASPKLQPSTSITMTSSTTVSISNNEQIATDPLSTVPVELTTVGFKTELSSNSTTPLDKFSIYTLAIYFFVIFSGIILCVLCSIYAVIKFRRKDAGVYEVEEAQRFRPLVVELSSSSAGDKNSVNAHSSSSTSKKIGIKQHTNKRYLHGINDEQREFYI